MNTADLIATVFVVAGGAASIFFAWQQNQIFREQNRIFAAQAGIHTPETPQSTKIGLYWPAIAAFLLAGTVGLVLAKVGTIYVAIPWALVALFAFGTTLSVMQLKGSMKSQQAATAENANLKQQLGNPTSLRSNVKAEIELLKNATHSGNTQEHALSELLSPLQIEALSIAKDLRDFLANLPPFPSDPQQYPDESDYDYLVRVNNSESLQKIFQERREKQMQWRQKLMHGYANRRFGERITALMHRAGEDLEYPAPVPNFAEKPPFGVDDVRKLAQQMETVAIWINRKQRGEVNLLS